MTADPGPTSDGFLLAGRVRYAQPLNGYRTGIEPVLLAAAVPARAGERVLEAGTGAGAGLLCLAARLPGISLVSVEIDPAMAALARHNIAENDFSTRANVVTGDITADLAPGPFDHACANPPWHAEDGTPSPDGGRQLAKRRAPETLARWSAALARRLRPRGTLTLILPAALLSDALAAVAEAGCGAISLVPFWPKPGVAARLMLVHGIRSARGPDRVLPGLTLHAPGGGYTAEAEAILRGGAALAGLTRVC